MRPVSDAFLRTVRGSHQVITRARLVPPGQTGIEPDGTEIPIESGDIQLDATAEIRSTLDLATEPAGWQPSPDAAIHPYGTEIHVERGVRYGADATEMVSLGYFRVDSVEQDDAPGGLLRVSASDRMAVIKDGRLTRPQQFSAGTPISVVVDLLVTEVLPEAEIEYDFDASQQSIPRGQVAEEDRYEFLADLATSLGKVMYFDHAGRLRLESQPDPRQPVFEINHGEDGVLVALSHGLSREGVYNAVVATGEGADTDSPVQARVYDINPESPTYWNGPFGKVPRFYQSSFIGRKPQARDAATSMLRKAIGLPYSMDLSLVPNPALEPLDPVRVTYTDRGSSQDHVIEKITIPLDESTAMDATTKDQSAIQIGTEGEDEGGDEGE